MIRVFIYSWITLCGFFAGWVLGSDRASLFVIPILLMAAACVFVLSRLKFDASPGFAGASSVAHQAWFVSSWACMLALGLVWLVVGWSLPGLELDGIKLDPAGALGWTGGWWEPRLDTVKILMIVGLVGALFAVSKWIWHKIRKVPPHVVIPWAAAPFFWMAALGLLVSLSDPWRMAPEHPIAKQWSTGMGAGDVVALANRALDQSKSDATSAVWAHALGVRAYQSGAWDRDRVDEFFSRLALYNQQRPTQTWFPHPRKVGVERQEWCLAQVARTPLAKRNWVVAKKQCDKETPGRQWSWAPL